MPADYTPAFCIVCGLPDRPFAFPKPESGFAGCGTPATRVGLLQVAQAAELTDRERDACTGDAAYRLEIPVGIQALVAQPPVHVFRLRAESGEEVVNDFAGFAALVGRHGGSSECWIRCADHSAGRSEIRVNPYSP